MKPFEQVKLTEPSKMQKMFKKIPSENSLEELTNILALKSFDELSIKDIEEINKKYKLNVTSKYKSEVADLFLNFVNYHLRNELPNDGSRFIPKFATILAIDKKKVDEILTSVGSDIFRSTFQKIVANRRWSDEDKKYLGRLWLDLGLSKDVAGKISGEVRWKVVELYLDTIKADGELSPEEDQELHESVISLTGDINSIKNLQPFLDKLRKVWQLNHGELPVLSTDILLQKKEICHFINQTDWYEQHVVRSRINYAGPTYRLKLAKGFYYRVGSIQYNQQPKEQLLKIDTGTLYITNKRLLFVGSKKNTSIQYSKIINVQPYKNGVEIIKDSGKNPFLAFDDRIDEVTALLIRLIANA